MEAGNGGAGSGPSIAVANGDEYEAASIVDQMPPGFRFHPTDEEIIIHYLLKKVMDRRFAALAIGEADLNKCEPWDLPKKAKKMGENEWWFFFQKDRKYATGMRTNRATESGYWKATGKDKEIHNKGKNCIVGMKKTLVFYIGRAPKGQKTNWIMHEYRLHGNFPNYSFSTSAKEGWYVCRVFHKKSGTKTSEGVQLARMESFVNHDLLCSPTMPPLTDYSCSSERRSSSFAAEEDELKANISSSKLMLNNNQLQMMQHVAPPLVISSHNQHSVPYNPNPTHNFCPQIVHPNSAFPYQSQSLVSPHQVGLNSTMADFAIKGADDQPNSRTPAVPNAFIGGQEPERTCKTETFSINNSIISHSQDTGFSTEMATEITSVYFKGHDESEKPSDHHEFEGLYFSPSISDLDSLWSY